MVNKLFKSMFALATVLGTALGFVACEQEEPVVDNPTVDLSTLQLNFTNEEGAETVDVIANAGWMVDEFDVDWITVTPMRGEGNGKITVSVPMNDTGAVREAVIKVYSIHAEMGKWDMKKLRIAQSADSQATVTEELLYGDNFDGKEATKTYGSGSSWPYIDQFPEFANPEGPAAANVTYTGSGVSVRANSTSNSSYSDYNGSGSNNIFFGANAHFQVNNITLDTTQASYKMTFGTEKYSQDGDSKFSTEEFKVFLSMNGTGWTQVDIEYAGTADGRWNVATANFTLTEVPENLYIKFTASVASVYRLDDLKLFTGNGGQEITLTEQGEEPEPPTPPTSDALYFDNFDGQVAVKDGSYWPYVSDFPEMKNAVGPASANVSYSGTNVTVRANSTSDGTYSDYEGSGSNNIFFGKVENNFIISGLALESSQKNLKLTFGTEKYSQDNGSLFTPSEFIVSLSNDGQNWHPIEYTFAGTAEGRWNVATGNFTLASVPTTLYIKFSATAASSYRLDDVTLDVGEGGQTIDLGEEGSGNTPTPEPPTTDALYFDNFDGQIAVKDGSYWPYVSDFPEMKNAAGSAAANVSYSGHNVTVRANSESNGTYSDYEGSGGNNIFFGKVENNFTISGLALESSQKNLKLTFGTEKYSQTNGSLFTPSEFIVSLSSDGENWTPIEYTFAGTAEGRWNVATADFTLAEVPATLYIKFSTSVESSYRLDDVTLDTGNGGQTIDLGEGGNTTPDPNPDPTPDPSEAIEATVAEFLAAAEDDTQLYILKGTITNVANTTYGNFDLTDETGTVYIYGLCSPEGEQQYWAESGAKLGDDITIKTIRTSFGGSPQGKNALFVDLVSPGTLAFWSFSKTATTFTSAGGEQVITVSAYNLTDSITATSDNAQFTAAYADGKLTITAKENTATDAINGNITVTAGALEQVITVVQGGVSVGGGTEVVAEATMVSFGWANATGVTEAKLDDNVTLTFAQGGASTAPTYYTSGEAVRLYQNGAYMTVSANGKTIKSMEITFADNMYYVAADSGELSEEAAVRTWTGDATEVKITCTGTDKSHRAYIQAIKVTYID